MSTRKGIKGKQLYRILFFGVIFTVVAVGALAFWGVREVRYDAAVVAVETSAKGLAGAVTVLVNSVTSSNKDMGEHALTSLEPVKLRKTFSTVFKEREALVSVILSDATGLRYMLTRREDGMMEGMPEAGMPSTLSWIFVGKGGQTHDAGLNSDFDRAAADKALAEEYAHLKPGEINWRSAYRFHRAGEPWVTASTLVQIDGQNVMVSYVFPIDKVVEQLGGAEKGGAEKVFLFWDNGTVLPIPPEEMEEALSPDMIPDPVVSVAAKMLTDIPANRDKPFSFTAEGQVWWSYVQPLSVFGETLSLGVAVPRRNIVSTLTSDTFLQVAGGVLVLFAGIVLFVLHRNKSRIEVLGLRQKAAQTPEDILRLIVEGESDTLEFKQTLRFNLKSGKQGREIEHASMKTVAGFLNSDGGTLLVGVADSGAVTGFDEDNFGSADKAMLHFNNLVNQYIGTEFARYLNTTIIEVQGKSVLRVHCVRAGAPAFLTLGKVEEFFVRSGPASRQLTLSQFYDWLQEH